jgi:hypothetical protein
MKTNDLPNHIFLLYTNRPIFWFMRLKPQQPVGFFLEFEACAADTDHTAASYIIVVPGLMWLG